MLEVILEGALVERDFVTMAVAWLLTAVAQASGWRSSSRSRRRTGAALQVLPAHPVRALPTSHYTLTPAAFIAAAATDDFGGIYSVANVRVSDQDIMHCEHGLISTGRTPLCKPLPGISDHLWSDLSDEKASRLTILF